MIINKPFYNILLFYTTNIFEIYLFDSVYLY